jgi:hypothetical protein
MGGGGSATEGAVAVAGFAVDIRMTLANAV